ncbi:phage tail tube protein [Vibrio mytili]|uniref:phage tail tube protein n=1 Tax=Vibrio mytili TaxID=50718 RepID=UPI002F3E4BCF
MAFTTPQPDQYAAIPAGSYFGYSTDGTTWTELPNIRGIGAVGETGTFVDVTPLSATKSYGIAGLKERPEVTFTFLDAPDETDWNTFTDAADAGEPMKIKIWFPNGRMVTGNYTLNGFQMVEPSLDAPIEFTVNAKQNEITWSAGEDDPRP